MSDIYREQLMEYYKNPVNRGKMDDSTVSVHEKNPFCGDSLDLHLKIENGVIKEAKFEGDSCAVSVASSAMLTEEITGMTLEQAKKVTKEELLDMLGVELTTSRVKCAVLILEGLQKGIKEYETGK